MTSESNNDDLVPTQEELDALIGSGPFFYLRGVRAALERRSLVFKWAWILVMTVSVLYIMGWFTGLLKPYMASAVTGLDADYQLHQLRFLLAFILIVIGTVALNFDRYVEEVFTTTAWIQLYFLMSGVGRQWRTMPDGNFDVVLIYAGNLLLILILLVILIFEERRLKSIA